jgi:hypothetical protein
MYGGDWKYKVWEFKQQKIVQKAQGVRERCCIVELKTEWKLRALSKNKMDQERTF